MSNNGSVAGDSFIQARETADPAQSEASKRFLNELMPSASAAARPLDSQIALVNSESAQLKANPAGADRPDIANGLFDENAPISHFDQVAPGVYRSGRPNGKEGVKEAVEKVWGNQQFDPDHASQTAIIELRGSTKGKFYQANEDEVNAEIANSADLGITHARFPMQSHDQQDPTFIQSVLDYVDQEKAAGNRVLIHCYHGTDRTGIIAAAYELTHDPQLQGLLKDNPAEAFKRGLKSMTDNGFSPQLYPELTQSLKAFVDWKHTQLGEHASLEGVGNTAAAPYLEIPSIWQKAA